MYNMVVICFLCINLQEKKRQLPASVFLYLLIHYNTIDMTIQLSVSSLNIQG